MVQVLPENDWGETIVQLPKMQAVDAAAAAVVELVTEAVVVDVAVPLAGGADDGLVVDAGEPLLLELADGFAVGPLDDSPSEDAFRTPELYTARTLLRGGLRRAIRPRLHG